MITGSYTNQDGGLHPNAVALATKMTVDLAAGVNTVEVKVYHDLASATPPAKPAPGQRPANPLTTKTFTLKGTTFTTDPAAIDVYLVGQPGFTGWTEVPKA